MQCSVFCTCGFIRENILWRLVGMLTLLCNSSERHVSELQQLFGIGTGSIFGAAVVNRKEIAILVARYISIHEVMG